MAKERLGLFDVPMRAAIPRARPASMLTPRQPRRSARGRARSIVLLKNEGGLLPIAAGARRIAVIGALAADANSQLGSWRAQGHVEDVHPLLPALREALPRRRDQRPPATTSRRRSPRRAGPTSSCSSSARIST